VQPWFFYVVRDANTRRALATAAFGQSFVAQAPVVIVVCAEPDRSAARYGDRGRDLYCLQDTANAITHMQLMAIDQGLGSCWVGAFDEMMAADVLSLPPTRRPVALIPIGRPARATSPRPRRPLADVCQFV
jgi:nitroreductase